MKKIFPILLSLFLLTGCNNNVDKKYIITNSVSLDNNKNEVITKEDDVTLTFNYEVNKQENNYEHIYHINIKEDKVENGKDLLVSVYDSFYLPCKVRIEKIDNINYFIGKFSVKYDGYYEEFDKSKASITNCQSFLFTVPNNSKNLEVNVEFIKYYDRFYVDGCQQVTYSHYKL